MSIAVSRRFLFGLLALAALKAPAAVRGDDVVPTENLLPPNVLLLVNIPDVDDFKERMGESSLGALIHDPSMNDVRAEVMKKFEEASKEAEEEIGMPLSDLLSIPSGAAAFALVQPAGGKLGGVVILDAGDHVEQLNALLKKGEGQMEMNGLTRSSTEFEGSEITTWTDENAADQPINSVSYLVKDGVLVASNSVDLVKDVLARWEGDHDETFAENETFAYIMDACQEDDSEPVLTWYVDPLGLFRGAIQAAGPEAGMQAAMVMGFLPVLGIDSLKGMGGVLEMSTEDYDGISRSLIYVEPPLSGVLRVMRCPPADLTPPKWIPATTSTINGMSWDVPGAYDAVEQMVDFFTAPGTTAKFLDDAAKHPMGPGLHPKTDFLDLLSGRIYMIQELEAGEGGMPQQRFLVMLGVNDQKRMEEVVGKLTTTEGVDLKVRDFNGVKIYEADGPGGQFEPAAAISNGYLMFASGTDLLESVLRGDSDEPLSADEDYQAVAEVFPAEVSTFSFSRQGDVMEGLYDLGVQALEQQDDFDVSILPEFEAIKKYFGLAGSYSVPDEKGVLMISFSLKPEL
jgi:hypothetical protein